MLFLTWPHYLTTVVGDRVELWLELSRESWSLWWWSTIKPPTSWLDLMLMLLLRLHWLALGRSNIMQTELAENQSCIYKYNAITVLDCALNRIPPHPDRYQNQDCFRYLYSGYTPQKVGKYNLSLRSTWPRNQATVLSTRTYHQRKWERGRETSLVFMADLR